MNVSNKLSCRIWQISTYTKSNISRTLIKHIPEEIVLCRLCIHWLLMTLKFQSQKESKKSVTDSSKRSSAKLWYTYNLRHQPPQKTRNPCVNRPTTICPSIQDFEFGIHSVDARFIPNNFVPSCMIKLKREINYSTACRHKMPTTNNHLWETNKVKYFRIASWMSWGLKTAFPTSKVTGGGV